MKDFIAEKSYGIDGTEWKERGDVYEKEKF